VTADVLRDQSGVDVDYLVLADPVNLHDVPEDFAGAALLAVAARVGTTRLIDNLVVTLGGR
jgi:pantoate--beta-alanine ligase